MKCITCPNFLCDPFILSAPLSWPHGALNEFGLLPALLRGGLSASLSKVHEVHGSTFEVTFHRLFTGLSQAFHTIDTVDASLPSPDRIQILSSHPFTSKNPESLFALVCSLFALVPLCSSVFSVALALFRVALTLFGCCQLLAV